MQVGSAALWPCPSCLTLSPMASLEALSNPKHSWGSCLPKHPQSCVAKFLAAHQCPLVTTPVLTQLGPELNVRASVLQGGPTGSPAF